MASGTADLQRDLGGAIMQSIFGALLTAGYADGDGRRDRARRASTARTPQRAQQLTKSFAERRGHRASSTRSTRARSRPRRRRRSSQGDQWAYTAGIVAVLLGAALVFFMFPKKEQEEQLLAEYHAEDVASHSGG